MEEFLSYRCFDGTVFKDKDEAVNYEKLARECISIEKKLGERVKLDRTSYIQHNPLDVINTVNALFAFIKEHVWDRSVHDWAVKNIDYCDKHYNYAEIIDNLCNLTAMHDKYHCINVLLKRLLCFDFTEWRGYQQPYFTSKEHRREENKEFKRVE